MTDHRIDAPAQFKEIVTGITYRTELKPGDIIICRVTSGMEYSLTEGKEYVCLEGLEPGIFHDRPYVSVLGDRNHKISCHASRFVKKEP